jgi:AraC-like DNA-binding protein
MHFGNLRVNKFYGVVRYKPSTAQWSARKRTSHIVGIILSGAAFHDFGYQQFTLSENCVYFLNQKDDYDVQLETESSTSFSIHFTTLEPIDTDSFCVSVSNPVEIISLLKKAEQAHSTENELLCLSYLYQLCHKLGQMRDRFYFPKDKRIHAAKEYIDQHFTQSTCVAQAIAQSQLSSRRFTELFRMTYDLTPNRYCTYRKIEYAKTLLSTKAICVTDAAKLCGFSDVYYFSKVFKSIAGVCPSQWE